MKPEKKPETKYYLVMKPENKNSWGGKGRKALSVFWYI